MTRRRTRTSSTSRTRPTENTLDGLLTLTSRAAIDVLNRDDAGLTDDLTGAVGAAVERALDAEGPAGRRRLGRPKRLPPSHWLCAFLEELVKELADVEPARAAGGTVEAGCREAHLDRTATTVVTAAAEKLTEIVLTNVHFTNPLTHVVFLLRIAAVAACPDPARHPSLDRTCANPLAGQLTSAAFEIRLRRETA